MNPTLSITVDTAKRKATAVGVPAVGELVDVSVTCANIGIADKMRFRVVDECGHDLVRFPLAETDDWTLIDEVFSAAVNFDTDKLRKRMRGVPFNERLEFGVIIDSSEDKAQYGVGRVKVAQWALASSDDPTVLPDWREVLEDLEDDLASVDASKTAAEAAATSASQSAASASASASAAATSAFSALAYQNSAAASMSAANEAKTLAQSAKASAEAAALNASVAAGHYPKIENGTWWVWDVDDAQWVDTEIRAQGPQGTSGEDGEDGNDGISPDVAINPITGGHSVTIYDADHPVGQTFNVMDGVPPDITNKVDKSKFANIPVDAKASLADLKTKLNALFVILRGINS